jgi:glycerol-3-phosphate dehydrogenase
MKRDLSRLDGKSFDLLVVGGGIIGASIVRDAADRGLSCALVDAGDFASGTSSKTTKLIHGGIRYLEQFDFGLVRESLRERALLLKRAPKLVQPLRFLIPVKGNRPRPWPLIRVGIWLYDCFAGRSPLEPSAIAVGKKLHTIEPQLASSGIEKAALYSDAQMDDIRLVLENLQLADEAGAVPANYLAVQRWIIEQGKIVGAELKDALTGRSFPVRARVVINATGPWADKLRQLADPQAKPIVRPSKGIHLVYPDLGFKHALLLSAPKDDRVFFVIPWRGMSLIGTTDTDYAGDPSAAAAESDDIEYLIRETNSCLPGLNLKKEQMIASFAGVRPLVAEEKKDPWAVSRSHKIHTDPNGLITVVGGKFTTHRAIAQEVVDHLDGLFKEKQLRLCHTALAPIGCAEGNWRSPEIQALLQDLLKGGLIHPAQGTRLVQRYGKGASKIFQWIKEDPTQAQTLCAHHPFIRAEIRYASECEMAMTRDDILSRRLQVTWSSCRGSDFVFN